MASNPMTDSQTDANADPFTRHRGPVTCVAGIPGRNAAVTSGYDSAVGIVDFEREKIELLGYHPHLVNRVVVDPTGKSAATCSSDYTVGLWDLDSRKLVRVLRGHWDDVEDFAFVDETTGVSVSRDRRILIWDLSTGAIVRTLEKHQRDVL
jgi:WD40 repeat protein